MAPFQSWADLLIALAYFSIPLELLYFAQKFKELPQRSTLTQFVCFILLCGFTHLIGARGLYLNPSTRMVVIASIAKAATALVSCLTALSLLHEIPRFLRTRERERLLRTKTEELDEEVGLLRRKEAVSHSVRMLAAGIHSSLDTTTILETTIIELSKVLGLDVCVVWESARDPKKLEIVCAVGLKSGCKEELTLASTEVQDILNSADPVHLRADTILVGSRTFAISHPLALVLPSLTFGGVKGRLKQYILVLAKEMEWSKLDMEILDITNSQISVAISHADILSDLKAQNEELEEARKAAEAGLRAREEFLAIVSHEMRTPLHAVLAIASVLQQSKTLGAEDLQMVTTISTSAGLLSVLIDDVLDMFRINRGDFQLRIAPFDLSALVKQAAKMIEHMARESGINVITEAPQLPEWVIGDGKRTMQMVLNLLNNAVKFTKTQIYFHVWEESLGHPQEHQIRVDVIDDGVGIEKHEIGSLCDRFRQLDTGRKAGGMGLGLSICRHLARLMGGSIWLESEGKGRGTTASMRIRLKRVSQDEQRSILRRHESIGSLKGLRVLVVDDNGVNRLVTCKMLGKLGCKAVSADSGPACLSLAEAGHYDVCLMDLTMPGMDGLETASRLLKLSNRPKYIVALTADQRLETVTRCLQAGMNGVLNKPATLETLRDSLLEHLASDVKNRA